MNEIVAMRADGSYDVFKIGCAKKNDSMVRVIREHGAGNTRSICFVQSSSLGQHVLFSLKNGDYMLCFFC